MEVMNNIKIANTPFESTVETLPYMVKERYKGVYKEYGEEVINTNFDLLKITKLNKKPYYQVVLEEHFSEEEENFIIKNILNSLDEV